MASLPQLTEYVLAAGMVLCLAVASGFVAKRYGMRGLKLATLRTKSKWDDALLDAGFFDSLTWFPPLIVIHLGSEILTSVGPAELKIGLFRLIHCFFIFGILRVALRFSDALMRIYYQFDRSKSHPIKGYVQLLKIFFNVMAAILIIAGLTGRSPLYFISGLGALTAILMLIFKDTILSLVASIQITTQRLICVGDWIEVPHFGADGDVIDVALHTITVQNWDKTVSIIPTSQLIEKGFKNWRGMQESGGRRIKRSISIDIQTVKFLKQEDLGQLSKLKLLEPYLKEKQCEIEAWNEKLGLKEGESVNGRCLTNLGCFREYLKRYLSQHPMIKSDGSMTFLVRQLQPMEKGIPLEIYVFCSDTRWAYYEGVQADIFDHVLAMVGQFDLKVFQNVSGQDLRGGLSTLEALH